MDLAHDHRELPAEVISLCACELPLDIPVQRLVGQANFGASKQKAVVVDGGGATKGCDVGVGGVAWPLRSVQRPWAQLQPPRGRGWSPSAAMQRISARTSREAQKGERLERGPA